MAVKPMLDDIELQLVQEIESEEEEAFAQHSVPALEGDFLQDLGRRASRFRLTGVMIGEGYVDALKTLRDKFLTAEPVSFVSDIATATEVDKVLIEEMGIRDLAGKPKRFEYALTLREFISPPPTEQELPPPLPPPPPPPPVETGTLVVEVIVEGDPNFDFSKVTVTVDGTEEGGTPLSRTLTNRQNNIWTEEDFPPGQYTARAVVVDPQPMSGSAQATVRTGQTTQVQIILRRGAVIAKAFVVHFWFDKAFVEPCMRHVLQQVSDYAQTHPDEKLVIVGHTDRTGPDVYNQSLSERRARSVYAYLTFGRDQTAARTEWNELRKQSTGGTPNLQDSWGTREYQYMLQDLGFYTGNINERHDQATDTAVRAFQQDRGLIVDGIVGDATWLALIDAYLRQDNLAVPEGKFLPNCPDEILKWLGCGEQNPVRNTEDAWRPNRRTELLFVNADALPCDVPQPDTFNLPTPGAVAGGWCLGPGNPNDRCCFIARGCDNAGPDKWCVEPAESGTVIVRGRIAFEDGTPLANAQYVLLAPDGEFLHKNAAEEADLGEVPQGARRGRHVFPPNRTDANGEFSYPARTFAGSDTTVGIYILEILEPVVARLKGEPIDAAKGNIVCKRLDGTSDFDVVVTGIPTSLEFVASDNPDSTVENVSRGGTVRVRADVPGVGGDVVLAEIIGDSTIIDDSTIQPPVSTAIVFVAEDNVETVLTNVQRDRRMRLRTDISNISGDTVTLEIIGSPLISP